MSKRFKCPRGARMNAPTTSVRLDLAGDPVAVARVLRHLLRRLIRSTPAVRCIGLRLVPNEIATPTAPNEVNR